MSEPLRIAVAVEGPTDAIVLRAIMDSVLEDTEFEFQTLQPEGSVAFGSTRTGETGVGWVGVYRWCRQSVMEGEGSVSGSSSLAFHDVVIIQVDADVAGKTYASGEIRDPPCEDLPCEQRCPPPAATTDALREVLLHWLGEPSCPSRIVLCTPSKSMESWVLAALCPDNSVVRRVDWECHSDPEGQLGTLPKPTRFSKSQADYRRRQNALSGAWPDVAARLTEAARFEQELRAALPD